MVENKLLAWHKRHNNAVNAVLDIACAVIPGAGILTGGLKVALAKSQDCKEIEQNEKAQEMEQVLKEIKSILSDVVEEVESLKSFKIAVSNEERRKAIEESEVKEELNKIMPELSLSLTRSIARMQKKKILKGKYEVLEKIGGGGQGEVHKGFHLIAKTPVAIKLLPKELSQDETAIERLRSEYQHLVKQLIHPNIVQYRDMDQDEENSQYFLVMDLIEGRNLRKILMGKNKKPMEKNEVGKLLLPVAITLDFAHENKIVHRDVKPENILIRDVDSKVFLTDFGLADEIHSSFSRKGKMTENISGTLPYMAPEQYKGQQAYEQTDNWALGVIAYEMLAGYHPFQGTSFDHYLKLVCDIPPAKIEGMPDETWKILQKMLQKDRKLRPVKAEEWINELLKGSKIPVLVTAPTKAEESEISPSAPGFMPPREDDIITEQKRALETLQHEIETERIRKEELRRQIEEEEKKSARLAKEREEADEEKKQIKEKLRAQKEEKLRLEEERKKEETRLAELKRQRKLGVVKTSADGRYHVLGSGIIKDTKTGLEWLPGPNKDMTWDAAKSWVKGIDSSKYGSGWQMPTREELKGLYEPEKTTGKVHIDAAFKNFDNYLWVWSSELREEDSSCAWDIPFDIGDDTWYIRSGSRDARAFAVRSEKLRAQEEKKQPT